eukprot:5046728-Amphidinium_carterae.1
MEHPKDLASTRVPTVAVRTVKRAPARYDPQSTHHLANGTSHAGLLRFIEAGAQALLFPAKGLLMPPTI